jgi:hypothetical protein
MSKIVLENVRRENTNLENVTSPKVMTVLVEANGRA